MGRGLSRQQKEILQILGNRTVNIYEPADELDPFPDGWLAHVRYGDVFAERYSIAEYPSEYWDESTPSQRVSFSRAVKSLMTRGLVEGLALAWLVVGANRNDCEGGLFWQWEGKGPRVLDHKFGVYDRVPRLKMLGLTETGWKLAHELWPDLAPRKTPRQPRRVPKRKQNRKK